MHFPFPPVAAWQIADPVRAEAAWSPPASQNREPGARSLSEIPPALFGKCILSEVEELP